MRWYVNVASRILTILLTSLYLLLIACKGKYEPMTQPDASSDNQAYMVSEMRRFEPMLDMGEFIATFGEPPAPCAPSTDGSCRPYAGWSECLPDGRPPWHVHFNKAWVDSLDLSKRSTYMSLLMAHEMCHYWVAVKKRESCSDEMAAELCGNSLVTLGRPE